MNARHALSRNILQHLSHGADQFFTAIDNGATPRAYANTDGPFAAIFAAVFSLAWRP